jgi:hypothetical protein
MRKQIFALATAMLLVGPVLADEPAPANASDPAATDEAHLDEMVCKKQPPPTGSRIAGKTVCLTNRQWLALWDESKRATAAMQNKSIGKGSTGN